MQKGIEYKEKYFENKYQVIFNKKILFYLHLLGTKYNYVLNNGEINLITFNMIFH